MPKNVPTQPTNQPTDLKVVSLDAPHLIDHFLLWRHIPKIWGLGTIRQFSVLNNELTSSLLTNYSELGGPILMFLFLF